MRSCIAPLLAVLLVLASCSPKVTRNLVAPQTPLAAEAEVTVLEIGTDVPPEAAFLGSVKVGESGFTPSSAGTYKNVIALVREEARKMGGNVALLTSHKYPDLYSSVHRVKADVYYMEDPSTIAKHDSLTKASATHPDYAVIYLYRPARSYGALSAYNVSVNDTKVYRCSNNSSAEVKIYEPGEYTIWAKTESRCELSLDIELGKDYYIECSISVGAFMARPVLLLRDGKNAYSEYKSIKNDE